MIREGIAASGLALRALARNLVAGLRLALLLPVSRLDFRVDTLQLLLLFALSCAIDVGGDWLRFGPEAILAPAGMGSELASLALMGVTAALVALALRQPALALAFVITSLAALPVLQVVHYLPYALEEFAPAATQFLHDVEWVVLLWLVVILVRTVLIHVAAAGRRRWFAAGAGGLVLALPLALAPVFIDESYWFQGADAAHDPHAIDAGSEPVLAAQRTLLDDALAALDDHESGGTNLYFVAYAPDANEAAWTEHMAVARKVMDERFATAGRSIVLRNHRETLLSQPFATVTNLRETLDEIGAAADPEVDVVMVYVGGRGTAGGRVPGVLPPLDLVPLTPIGLKRMLDDAGLRWRVIVVAACYAGAYAAVLDDPRTAVIAASESDRPSFGCEERGDATYFGEALFTEGLARTVSLPAAFAVARDRVAARERARGLSPSNPVLQVGDEIGPKLRSLRIRGGGTTARRGRSIPGVG